MTIMELSKKVGISRELLGKIECNKSSVGINTLDDICNELGLEIRILIK